MGWRQQGSNRRADISHGELLCAHAVCSLRMLCRPHAPAYAPMGHTQSTRACLEAHARLQAGTARALAQPLAQEQRRVPRAPRQQEAPPLAQLRIGWRVQGALQPEAACGCAAVSCRPTQHLFHTICSCCMMADACTRAATPAWAV